MPQGLDLDRSPAEGLHLGLAGQAVQTVDRHAAGAADPVTAGAAEGQGPVLLPFDFVQHVQNGYKLGYYQELEVVDEDGHDRDWVEEVIEDDESDELKANESMLWWILEYFGGTGSKHDKERIRIVRQLQNGEYKD